MAQLAKTHDWIWEVFDCPTLVAEPLPNPRFMLPPPVITNLMSPAATKALNWAKLGAGSEPSNPPMGKMFSPVALIIGAAVMVPKTASRYLAPARFSCR